MKRFRMPLAAVVLAAGLGSGARAQGAKAVTVRGQFPTAADVESQFSGGAHEVRFRDVKLTEEQFSRMQDRDYLRQLGEAMPKGRGECELQVRATTPQGRPLELRLNRDRDETLRARLEGAGFSDPARAKELVSGLKESFSRVEMRGRDMEGRRFRFEAGEDRRRERMERHERQDRRERMEDHERGNGGDQRR